ncbi:hypothetical protein A9G39_03095 [Gilliamella sp. Imp1-6]|nr:hypothetical protein A9G39_03095 [Gilliamella apicola]
MKFKEIYPINYDRFYSVKDETLQDLRLESLAPKRTNNNIAYYSKIINAGIQDNSVQNIAITGSYGAGKSSVLKTFKEDYPKKYKYLNISLANFRDKSNTGEIQSKIRLSILQQIFYHAHIRKIPDSRFKRIKAFSSWSTIFFLMILAVFLISFSILFKPEILSELPLINILLLNSPMHYLIALVYWFLLFISLFYFLKMLYHAKFGIHSIKLNAKGDIEVNGAKKESHLILNEYLDEILYLFERKKFNVVIIEDLDRFNDITIFEELRELNFLINNAKQLRGKKVTFIYALNDCLFELIDESPSDQEKISFSATIKNKTKFFDLIIPIIPFINVTNSYNFLKKRNEESNDYLSKSLLNKISFYIDDMRLLTNIMNEYQIYCEQIITQNQNSLNLDYDQLFSIILIKNFFPQEFEKLHCKEKSIINNIFDEDKKKFIKNKLVELRKKEERDEKTDKQIKLLSNPVLLRDLIHEFDDKIDFLTENKLIDYLLKYGYLTEEYHYYISLLHKNALSINDHLFIKQFLPSEKQLSSDFKLNNLEEVYTRITLDEKDFESVKVFNCDLINYLILHRQNNKRKYSDLVRISQLFNVYPQDTIKLIDTYFKNANRYKDSISYFTYLFCHQWDNFWEYLQTDNKQQNIFYAKYILHYLDSSQFNRLLKNQFEFIKYITNCESYFSAFQEVDIEKLNDLINSLQIKFKCIDLNVSDSEIDFLLSGEHYQINFYNVFLILNKKIDLLSRSEFKKKSYSIVNGSTITPLIDYVDVNLDEFISNVMCAKQPNHLIEEDEDLIISILNEDITLALRTLLIKNLKNPLSKLDNLHYKDLWPIVIQEEKIIPKWENVITYYGQNELDDILITYLRKSNVQEKLTSDITNNKPFINDYIIQELPLEGVISSLSINEDCFLSVLNNENLDRTIKIKIIKSVNTKNYVTYIEDINDHSLWTTIFSENLISTTLMNVLVYYRYLNEEIDEALIKYLNIKENYHYLKEDILDHDNFISINGLFEKLLSKDTISKSSYYAIVNIFYQYSFDSLELEAEYIDIKKAMFAIYKELIILSPSNYEKLKELNLHYYLVRKSYDEFIDDLENYDINDDDLNILLDYPTKLESKKLLLTEDENETITYINKYGLEKLIKFNLLDDETLIINLFNNENLEFSRIEELVEKLPIKIKNISIINNVDIQTLLFEQQKAQVLWKNIYHYYEICDRKINQTLIEFFNIEQNSKELVTTKFVPSTLSTENQDVTLFKASILYQNEIDDNIYFMFADTFGQWNSINLPELSDSKINYLIDKQILCLTNYNYKLLKRKFPNKHINLLEVHSELFLKFQLTENLNLIEILTGSDYLLLLESDKFNENKKIKIIEKIPERVIQADDDLAQKLLDKFKGKRNHNYPIILLIKIFIAKGNEDNKIKLITQNLPRLNNEDLSNLLKRIPNLEKLGRCSNSTIDYSKKYETFFNSLSKIGYLRKIKVENNLIKGKKRKQFKLTIQQ